jgi:periplasmic mercuric ion binding protein
LNEGIGVFIPCRSIALYFSQIQFIKLKFSLMKAMRIVLIALLAVCMNINIHSQDNKQPNMSLLKTASFMVYGNCDLCKSRIEKAAKIDGVSKADWNKETKLITLAYTPSKVTSDDVQKKIATAGHDTEKFKADDKAYSALPECCHYDRKK